MENIKENNDRLIRKSFENLPSKAPDYVWEKINNQLYIDNIWKNIDSELDVISNRKKRFAYLGYPAAILILLLILSSIFTYFNSSENRTAGFSDSKNSSLNIITKIIESKKENYSKSILNKNHPENKKQSIIMSNHPDISHLNNADKFTYSKNNNYNLSLNSTKIITESGVNSNSNRHNDSLNILMVNSLYFSQIGNNYDPEIEMINSDISNVKTNSHTLQLGVIYSINNTMIINQDLIENYREESTIRIDPTLASSFGILLDIKKTPRTYFSTEIYLISNHRQFANLYSNGRYYKKGIELEYKKIVVSYKRLYSFKAWSEKSDMFFKTGAYVSYLTSNDIYYMRNDIKTDEQNFLLYKYDYGLKISAGREMYLGRFSMSIGIQAEYGLKNIFKGSEDIPSYFNRTNNFSHGLFVSLKHIK